MGTARLSGAVLAALLAATGSAAARADCGNDWVPLFDGRSLAGWTPKIRGYPAGENFADTFRVEDGLLTVSYDGYDAFGLRFGHLFHDRPYSHYRLRVEYRFVGEPAADAPAWALRNSGVMLHAQSAASMGPEQDFPISLELQFLGGLEPGVARPTGNLCTPGTHVVRQGRHEERHCLAAAGPTVEGDDWVLAEALVLGNERLVHYIDGAPVIDYERPTTGGGSVSGHREALKREGAPLGAGYIALQSESHPVQFRRVEILDLAGCDTATGAAGGD